ncbi:MAG: flagellar motor switch protein FliN [Proteobacteria bacterium]|nr:flagellar motor switch protein FliN [Pseudomonadota bacterium]
MTPSDIDQSDDTPEGTESAFDQPMSGAAEFGVGQIAGIAEPTQTEADPSATSDFGNNSAMIMGLPVMMKVVLGSAKMPVATLAKLAKGSVVKLDKMVGDPVDILVNGRLIARGEVVVLNEGTSRFGVVLTQVGAIPGVTK